MSETSAERIEKAEVLEKDRVDKAEVLAAQLRHFQWEMRTYIAVLFLLVVVKQFTE